MGMLKLIVINPKVVIFLIEAFKLILFLLMFYLFLFEFSVLFKESTLKLSVELLITRILNV